MRTPSAVLLSVVLAFASAQASAQHAPPLGARPDVGGPRTQVLNLGSTHLSQHAGWERDWLRPLVARLVAWRPQVVTVEVIPGAQCELMRQVPQRYAGIYTFRCPDSTGFQRALETTQPEAERDAADMLAAWPASPTPAQRRRLAMLFLAAGDRPSAQVQWLRLPEAERIAADGLTDDALEVLDRSGRAMDESYEIAAVVAAAVGLERIHSVDDHTAVVLGETFPEGFDDWQRARFEAIAELPHARAREAAWAAVDDARALLDAYVAMNAPGAQDAQVQADFGGAFADARFGRHYGGWWETRNLRMVANIREAITPHPGARVLNIVGASHKPWYDQWSRQMADVEVVDAQAVLTGAAGAR